MFQNMLSAAVVIGALRVKKLCVSYITDKKIDFTTVDFKKLKVKDLKKILSDWGEDRACKGCSEKSDFVRVVKELLPKYAPEAAAKLKSEL